MERLARNGWIRTGIGLLAALLLTAPGMAQPTFGGPRPKPKPGPDGKPVEPAKPGKTPAPEVTQPPEEWSQDDAELRKDPTAEGAKPGEWYCWKTTDGLRYAWSLPIKYEPGKGYDIVVMMHPERMDFRWGPSNHLRADDGFRPDCICVSVDGMAANAKRPELRSFESTPENCVRFRDVLLEFTRNFPMRHMILYGEGGGREAGSSRRISRAAFPGAGRRGAGSRGGDQAGRGGEEQRAAGVHAWREGLGHAAEHEHGGGEGVPDGRTQGVRAVADSAGVQLFPELELRNGLRGLPARHPDGQHGVGGGGRQPFADAEEHGRVRVSGSAVVRGRDGCAIASRSGRRERVQVREAGVAGNEKEGGCAGSRQDREGRGRRTRRTSGRC